MEMLSTVGLQEQQLSALSIHSEDLPEWMSSSEKFYAKLLDCREAAVNTRFEMLEVRRIASDLWRAGKTEVSRQLHSACDEVEKYNVNIKNRIVELAEMRELIHEPDEVGELSGDQMKKHLSWSEKNRKLLDELEKSARVDGLLLGVAIGALIGGLCVWLERMICIG